MQHSVAYTVGFAAAVCGVCSIFVSSSAVSLKSRQEENKVLDRQEKVLSVAGLMPDEGLSREEVKERFDNLIKPRVVNLQTGAYDESVDASAFDQRKAAADPSQSRIAPENAAKVQRLPRNALVYHVMKQGQVDTLILPIEGKGLWSTMYGFLALARDGNTVRGITFYEHGETPGLGGEVENPRWQKRWESRKAFDSAWQPQLTVIKGMAGSPAADPHRVDGLAGATLTARGVAHLVKFWLGESGFGPYLAKFRAEERS